MKETMMALLKEEKEKSTREEKEESTREEIANIITKMKTENTQNFSKAYKILW